MYRAKLVGGFHQVFQRQFEEQFLSRFAFVQFPTDVVVTVLDGVIEDRRI
jgi:hypothetical protein